MLSAALNNDMRFELRPIPIPEIDEHWPLVRKGVEKILFKMRGTYDLLPEELFVFLKRGMAYLYLIILDGNIVGWLVLRVMQDEFTHRPYTLIWLGESSSTMAKELAIKEVERLAKNIGHYKVAMMGRMGWERRPPEGWKVVTVILEKELG
jgi:hypothetical protein